MKTVFYVLSYYYEYDETAQHSSLSGRQLFTKFVGSKTEGRGHILRQRGTGLIITEPSYTRIEIGSKAEMIAYLNQVST